MQTVGTRTRCDKVTIDDVGMHFRGREGLR